MSSFNVSFHHQRILDIFVTLCSEGKITVSDFEDKYEMNKRTILRDIEIIRNYLEYNFDDNVNIVYNWKYDFYELVIIEGKFLQLDLPYKF